MLHDLFYHLVAFRFPRVHFFFLREVLSEFGAERCHIFERAKLFHELVVDLGQGSRFVIFPGLECHHLPKPFNRLIQFFFRYLGGVFPSGDVAANLFIIGELHVRDQGEADLELERISWGYFF